LGNTGLTVSAIGLGTVKLGRNTGLRHPESFELPDERSAGALLARARELGINLLDTAPAYGISEERLGRLLAGQRQHWLLATKVGEEFDGARSRFDFSPAHTRRSVERSLHRLRTDVLDLVLVHSNGEDERIIDECGTLETLRALQSEGLVRAVGMSTKTVSGGLRAAALCDVLMVSYGLTDREQAPVLNACSATGCGVLLKKVLAGGHLPRIEKKAALLHDSLALALAHPATGSALVGTLSARHLTENVEVARAFVS
jgi:aryl-alcohol dehydrogenase-like predicted oxidoreductase